MEADRARWNARYQEKPYDFTPARWLRSLEERIRPARPRAWALDLACGGGRNSLYLAELGYRVDAWDVSDVALDILRSEVDRRNASGAGLRVETRQADLERANLPADRYDLVLDYHFLERSLFPAIAAALRPGGLLVFQTMLAPGLSRPDRGSVNPAYLLRPGELGQAFPTLETLLYEENEGEGVARLLASR